MTDEQAKRIRTLITNKEQLLETLGLLTDKDGKPSNTAEFQTSFRVRTGMYSGYPFSINYKLLEVGEYEFVKFLTHSLRTKLEEINHELSNSKG